MLDFSNPGHRWIYSQGGFEPETTAILRTLVRPNECFVDIGANVGWHSMSLLAGRPDVNVSYAFEPSESMCCLLDQSIAANDWQKRCHLKRLALSHRKGVATLKTFVGLDPMHASLYPLGDSAYKEEAIEMDTLDSQAESFSAPIGVIKVDVEGAERDVLTGAQGVLSGRFGQPPVWLLEANYETSGMANFFPWQLVETAAQHAPYEGYFVRHGRIIRLPHPTALRHGDTLVLAIPELHQERLEGAQLQH